MAPLEQRTVPAKVCKRCGLTKSASEFYRNKLMSDGLYSHCKVNGLHTSGLCKESGHQAASAHVPTAPGPLCCVTLELTVCRWVLVGVADAGVAEQACYSQAAEERSAGRVPAETKECRRCHETKGKADFYHSKMTADGLQSYCKVWLPYITRGFPCMTPLLATSACCVSAKVVTKGMLAYSNATRLHQPSGALGQQRAPSHKQRARMASRMSACIWRMVCLCTKT